MTKPSIVAPADIVKFSGFKTADGRTFPTQKEATQHIIDTKAKAALEAFAEAAFAAVAQGSDEDNRDYEIRIAALGFSDIEGQYTAISKGDLATFLFLNKTAILAAFKQEVRMRAEKKPRDPNAPVRARKSKTVAVPTAAMQQEAAAGGAPKVKAMSATEIAKKRAAELNGVSFMDVDDDSDLGGVDVADDARVGAAG